MKNKIILLLVVAGTIFVGQNVYAADPSIYISPATASKNVGVAFNIAVKVDPQGGKVCVVKGTLSFNNLTCQNITVASGVMAQIAPTCANPSFNVGIQKCASVAKSIFTISVKGDNVGQAVSLISITKTLGVGVVINSATGDGAYNITKTTNPTSTPASTPVSASISPTPTTVNSASSCLSNWQIGSWGACADSLQTRTVTDLNNCGDTTSEPDTIQSCQEQSTAINQNVGAASLLDVVRNLLSSFSKSAWISFIWIILIIILVLIIWWTVSKSVDKFYSRKN